MTTVLAQKGQIVIPKAIRSQMNLEPGDDFEIFLESGEIVLHPLPKGRNVGLAALLANPPGTLDIPDRNAQEIPEILDFDS